MDTSDLISSNDDENTEKNESDPINNSVNNSSKEHKEKDDKEKIKAEKKAAKKLTKELTICKIILEEMEVSDWQGIECRESDWQFHPLWLSGSWRLLAVLTSCEHEAVSYL